MKSTKTSEELKTALSQFHGTENYYTHSVLKNLVFTDGVKFLADEASAYWLIDAIASHQCNQQIKQSPDLQDFQLWKLEVDGNKGVLFCYPDSDQPYVVRQEIEFTDFPLNEISFYLQKGSDCKVLMLPSEY
jgi:hypothetical protein